MATGSWVTTPFTTFSCPSSPFAPLVLFIYFFVPSYLFVSVTLGTGRIHTAERSCMHHGRPGRCQGSGSAHFTDRTRRQAGRWPAQPRFRAAQGSSLLARHPRVSQSPSHHCAPALPALRFIIYGVKTKRASLPSSHDTGGAGAEEATTETEGNLKGPSPGNAPGQAASFPPVLLPWGVYVNTYPARP